MSEPPVALASVYGALSQMMQFKSGEALKQHVQSHLAATKTPEAKAEFFFTGLGSYYKSRPRVCLVARPGHCKSSLLNAIIGMPAMKVAPPTNEGGAVTPAPTEFINDPNVAKGMFKLEITTVQKPSGPKSKSMGYPECWSEVKGVLLGMANDGRPDVEKVAKDVLCEVYGKPIGDITKRGPGVPDTFYPRLEKAFKTTLVSREELPDKLAQIHEIADGETTHGVCIEYVTVSGPFDKQLPEDVILVDLPGLLDAKRIRSARAERYLKANCTHFWLLLPAGMDEKMKDNDAIMSMILHLARTQPLQKAVLVRTKAHKETLIPGGKGLDELEAQFVELKAEMKRLRICARNKALLEMDWVPNTTPFKQKSSTGVYEAVADMSGVLQKLDEISEEQERKLMDLWEFACEKLPSLPNAALLADMNRACDKMDRQLQKYRKALEKMDTDKVVPAVRQELTIAGNKNVSTLCAILRKREDGFLHLSTTRRYDLIHMVLEHIYIGDLMLMESVKEHFNLIRQEVTRLNPPPFFKDYIVARHRHYLTALDREFTDVDGPISWFLYHHLPLAPPSMKGVKKEDLISKVKKTLEEAIPEGLQVYLKKPLVELVVKPDSGLGAFLKDIREYAQRCFQGPGCKKRKLE